MISTVYGKHTEGEREELWASMRSHMPKGLPWFVGGDFNVVASMTEHKGRIPPSSKGIEDFSQALQICELSNITPSGGLYTWNGRRTQGMVWCRLDRVVVNPRVLEAYEEVTLTHLSKSGSDHKPILLKCSNPKFDGPKNFRFTNAWLTHKEFLPMIKKYWHNSSNVSGMMGFAEKLKQLKPIIREWNKEIFGDIFLNVKKAELVAAEKQVKYEEDPTEELRCESNLAAAKLLQACNVERIFWEQKANISWLKEGDSNTKFFHSYVKGRRAKLKISTIRDDMGINHDNEDQIGNLAVEHFTNLFADHAISNPESITTYIPTTITEQDNNFMRRLPEVEEVREAIWSLNPDAAADDLVIFLNGNTRNLLRLMSILKEYNLASGQDINWMKSRFFVSSKTPIRKCLQMEKALQIRCGKLPFIYLGGNITKGILRKEGFQPILQHFDKFLSSWYSKVLNPMGRLILIKHVLSSIPLHHIAVCELPKSIINTLHAKMKNFLWGYTNGNAKHHWKSWEYMCKPKKEGGLGIRDLHQVQKAYSLKLIWKINHVENLWTNFMKAKYISNRAAIKANLPDSPTWKRICKAHVDLEDDEFGSSLPLNLTMKNAYDLKMDPYALGTYVVNEVKWDGGPGSLGMLEQRSLSELEHPKKSGGLASVVGSGFLGVNSGAEAESELARGWGKIGGGEGSWADNKHED
ncbi:unnamed protein product [Cuscuta campestris]|uniref:Endonuclease/exonuclease/phosphatase domain-containing protein n=1 Tax=Cuscuta campestris TaxID=132261 RepID=A0A484M2P2_9ASTE|nr:unnamed protein product [Cuscuta campestris]